MRLAMDVGAPMTSLGRSCRGRCRRWSQSISQPPESGSGAAVWQKFFTCFQSCARFASQRTRGSFLHQNLSPIAHGRRISAHVAHNATTKYPVRLLPNASSILSFLPSKPTTTLAATTIVFAYRAVQTCPAHIRVSGCQIQGTKNLVFFAPKTLKLAPVASSTKSSPG